MLMEEIHSDDFTNIYFLNFCIKICLALEQNYFPSRLYECLSVWLWLHFNCNICRRCHLLCRWRENLIGSVRQRLRVEMNSVNVQSLFTHFRSDIMNQHPSKSISFHQLFRFGPLCINDDFGTKSFPNTWLLFGHAMAFHRSFIDFLFHKYNNFIY